MKVVKMTARTFHFCRREGKRIGKGRGQEGREYFLFLKMLIWNRKFYLLSTDLEHLFLCIKLLSKEEALQSFKLTILMPSVFFLILILLRAFCFRTV